MLISFTIGLILGLVHLGLVLLVYLGQWITGSLKVSILNYTSAIPGMYREDLPFTLGIIIGIITGFSWLVVGWLVSGLIWLLSIPTVASLAIFLAIFIVIIKVNHVHRDG